MSDRDDARMALSMAGKDLVAAQNMLNGEVFADEVFGFHVQQAMEKSLKAWIAYVGREYPPTHNLATLLSLLEEAGGDVTAFWDVVEYTAFAVQFRYEVLSDG